MTRTDDDWDVTDGVAATALGVALARAREAASECPLFTDQYAEAFLDAARARGWRVPRTHRAERIGAVVDYTAARTKWFDDFFIAAGANGVNQAVILAAGLDARAWRLPWVGGSVVYEIDQRKILEFKAETMRAHDAQPATRYVAVPVDLRQDWPTALRDAGFDPTAPTAWSAEGLLPYLPSDAQDLLFERIHELSAHGSRIGVESFGAGFFDPDYLASHRERLREEAGSGDIGADVGEVGADPMDLWFIEDRTDVARWLMTQGWDVKSVEAADLMERYGRAAAEADTPRTVFIEGELAA